MTLTLITSASYVEPELSAEFGRLPPAFLPVGHRRIYEIQAELLGSGTWISLPASFTVPRADEVRLAEAGVSVIRVPDGLRLGESILYALEMIGAAPGPVRILHGDTIIYDLPTGDDVLAVGEAPDAYEWGSAAPATGEGADGDPVLSGYFAFSDGTELRRALAAARGDFLAALAGYGRVVPLANRVVTQWLDFGHLQTYYRSRCSVRTQRAFNEMSISYRVVEKRSADHAKIAAEAAWFESLPAHLRLYTPGYLGQRADGGVPSYAIEYLPIPSLHELFVFGSLAPAVWERIVGSCFEFMSECIAAAPATVPDGALEQLTVAKTGARLDAFFATSGIDPRREWKYAGRQMPSLGTIAALSGEAIDLARPGFAGIMHGDLCFTNIFHDFRTSRIRVIDPRGSVGAVSSVAGDVRYDMAKLHHSIHGAYDFILADRYACAGFADGDVALAFPGDSSFDTVNQVAAGFDLAGRRLCDPENLAITVHLFLSMLPLHADNPSRQQAFVANALRLFAELPGT